MMVPDVSIHTPPKPSPKYKIIESFRGDIVRFEADCNKLLAEGWYPHGGLCVIQAADEYGSAEFGQAFVKGM